MAQASKEITEGRLNCMVRACNEERWRTHTEESVEGGYNNNNNNTGYLLHAISPKSKEHIACYNSVYKTHAICFSNIA